MKKLSLLFIFLITIIFTTYSQGFLKTEGTDIVNDDGKIILKGINLGNWLITQGFMMGRDLSSTGQSHTEFWFDSPNSISEFVGGDSAAQQLLDLHMNNWITETDIKIIADAGFNHVRVPFHYNLFYDNGTLIDKGFTYFDRVVQWCKAHNIYAIFDLHAAPGAQNNEHHSDSQGSADFWLNYETNSVIAINIWKSIATRYKDETAVGGYDLLNEPTLSSSAMSLDNKLNDYYMTCIDSIRTIDTNHIVFCQGDFFSTDIRWIGTYNDDDDPTRIYGKPFDDNMVLSIHNYWTNLQRPFTPYNLDEVPFNWYDRTPEASATSGNPGHITISLAMSVPLYLGEFGENSNIWMKKQVELAERDNVNWCAWTYKKTNAVTALVNQGLTIGYDYGLFNSLDQEALDYYEVIGCHSGNTDYGYWAIQNIWNLDLGGRSMPSTTEAYDWIEDWILRGNADNYFGETFNNQYDEPGGNILVYNSDFGDALLRETHSEVPEPYAYEEQYIPDNSTDSLVIRAINYDLGDNGIAYLEISGNFEGKNDDWNVGYNSQMRNDASDIDSDLDQNQYYRDTAIFYISNGEWYGYTVNIPKTGTYELQVEGKGNASFYVELGDANLGSFNVSVPNDFVSPPDSLPDPPNGLPICPVITSSWNKAYRWVKTGTVELPAGRHQIKVVFNDGGTFRFKTLSLKFIEEKIITSIEENKVEINLYPNPTEGKVYLPESIQYFVYDVYGNKLLSKKDNVIDLSSFNDGVYLVRFIDENSTSTQRIIKQ